MFLGLILLSEDCDRFYYLREFLSFMEGFREYSNKALKDKVRMPYQISLWRFGFFFSDSIVGTFIKFV